MASLKPLEYYHPSCSDPLGMWLPAEAILMANWQIPDAKWEAKLTLQSILNPEDDRQEDWQLCVNARQAVSKTRHAFILH